MIPSVEPSRNLEDVFVSVLPRYVGAVLKDFVFNPSVHRESESEENLQPLLLELVLDPSNFADDDKMPLDLVVGAVGDAL